VTALGLDTGRARTVARALTAIGDELYREAVRLRGTFDELMLGAAGREARVALERASATSWRDATFLGLVCDRLEQVDVGSLPVSANELWMLAAGRTQRTGWLGPWRDWLGASREEGDRGGTFDAELRRPLHVFGSDGVARGRSLLGRLLEDLADPIQIRADEIELVQLATDRYVVALPGVIDLSRPHLGLDEAHRSVRDLDQYAIGSSRSSAVADNRYAQMVWTALERTGVPAGAELMIVGHSFGADTALDLAADRRFNGGSYRVTHVVAAGYASRPQLADVDADTDVLVLLNDRDAAVIVEALGQTNAARSVVARGRLLSELAHFDVTGALDSARDVAAADLGAMIDAGDVLVEHGTDLREIALGIGSGDWPLALGAAADLLTLEPGVERVGERAVVDVFDGGGDGAGHHPTNYVDHLVAVDHPAVTAFLRSLDDAGYAATASAVAIDVSVP
jgi:hypothetical protein